MSNIKNLSLSVAKKQRNDKFKDKKRVNLDGKFKVDVDVVFSPSKKDELITELFTLIKDKFENNEIPDSSRIFPVVTSLIIKHFSTMDTKEVMGFDNFVEMHLVLHDLGYLPLILLNFDKNEIESVMNRVAESLNILTGELNKQLDEIKAKELVEEVEIDGEEYLGTQEDDRSED